MKRATMLFASALLLMAGPVARADDIPPKVGKPLSEIIKSVENQKAGIITEVEFDDGFWEVQVHKGVTETTFYLDPKTGKVTRQRNSPDIHETLPPRDGKLLSEIVKTLEDQRVGTVSELEFDDGFWEVTVRSEGKKVKMNIDPHSGKS